MRVEEVHVRRLERAERMMIRWMCGLWSDIEGQMQECGIEEFSAWTLRMLQTWLESVD